MVRTTVDPWLFGALLLTAWGLFAYGLWHLRGATPLRLIVGATSFALALFVWSELAPRPRVQLGEVRLRTLPSTASPGVVELFLRNSGSRPADVVAVPVAHLAPLFRTSQALAAGGAAGELTRMLDAAGQRMSDGSTTIAAGQTTRLDVEIPASQRAWYVGRGEATVLVAARVSYRDRIFPRAARFCLFVTPPSAQWSSCPFLND